MSELYIDGKLIFKGGIGTIHNVSSSVQTVPGVNVSYCVTNRMCYVQVWGYPTSTYSVGQNQAFLAAGILPKPKMNVLIPLSIGSGNTLIGNVFCDNPAGDIFKINVWVAGPTYMFGVVAYPVADDWEET